MKSYLWAYLPGKSPFRQKPDRIAKRNYYYCFDREEKRQFDFEHTLQKLEDLSISVLRKLRTRSFRLDPEERLTLAGYVALSYTRVPTFERLVDRFATLDTAFKLDKFVSDPENLKLVAREESEKTGSDNIGIQHDVVVTTDTNGRYLAEVPAGFYDVFVSAMAFTPTAAKVRVKKDRITYNSTLRPDPLVSRELAH